MKKTLLIILVFSFILSAGQADEWRTVFEKANSHYSNGEYPEALQQYLAIYESGGESGELFFNIGNTYYKMNQIGYAILFYEKAKKYIPADEALLRNLRIVELRKIDEIQEIPELFLAGWWNFALNLFSIELLGYAGIVLFLFLSVFLSLQIVCSRKVFKNFTYIFGTLFIISIVLFSGKAYQSESEHFGIVIEKKVSVKGEPAFSATELFVLHEGTKVEITRQLQDWVEITIADGKTGWCKLNNIGQI